MRPLTKPNLISVVIPVYNGEAYLAEALESVFAQTYSSIEVVVVDDGSADRTAEVARSFSDVLYVHQANQGNSVARNTGLDHCSGAFLSSLDADDHWPTTKCVIQMQYLQEHPQTGCVIGRMRNFLVDGMEKPGWIPDAMMQDDWVALSLGAMLAHRWVFEQVGNFNPIYWHGNDLDWFIRLKEAGIPIGIMPEVFLHRRIHGSNESRNQNVLARERVRILKASIDRKRGIRSAPIPGIR
jgi:glycosyltransferase involved in cell wall biosynthesis